MDRKSVIGFILIAVILFGFTAYQSKQQEKLQAAARVELLAKQKADSISRAEYIAAHPDDTLTAEQVEAALAAEQVRLQEEQAVYADAALESAHRDTLSGIVSIENEKVRVDFNTLGAQPSSVLVKDYYNYDSTALRIFNPGGCEYAVTVYAGELIRTTEFNFSVAEKTDSSVTMRLPFSNGGYIEQKYVLEADSYKVNNTLSFVGMGSLIPRNVSNFDVDFNVIIPRMEKGFKNESQYSKLDYYFDGDKKPEEMGRGRSNSKRIDSKLSWFAFQQQFFSAIMCAPDQFAAGKLGINFYNEDDKSGNLMSCTANMKMELQKGDNVQIPFEFYFGPNHFQTLKGYGRKYEKIIPLGGWLVGWFTQYVIIPLFNFLHKYFDSFGLIILLMTLIIKTVVLPLTNKSFLSSAKMAALKPEIEKINARYPKQEDAMKKQQVTMELYKRAEVNQMGGCLPTLLTFPILWAMFRFFPASIELRQQSFLWCHDLSAYDSIIDYGTRIPIFGDHLSLFALLMAVTMWIYSKMTMASQPVANDPSASSMRFMTLWFMPIMMFFICNSLSAALSYYYLLSQLYSIVQNWVIRKWVVKPEKVLQKYYDNLSKPMKKSKWQMKMEEMQKMQEAQMKSQQKRR